MTAGSELLLPDEMTLRGAGEALAARLQIEDGVRYERDRIYYDTFDGLLRDAGLTLMHVDGTLSLASQESGLVRGLAPDAGADQAAVRARAAARPAARHAAPVTDVRALLPLVHLHSRERVLSVLDGERKTVVRLALEETGCSARTARTRRCGRACGSPASAATTRSCSGVQEALVAELGFKPADQPLVDEAVRAAGGVPGGLPTKVAVPLQPDQRSDAAAAVVLRGMLEVIEANLDGTIADLDTEFLHDLRVSVRRSRAVQRELKRVFPPDELAHYRARVPLAPTGHRRRPRPRRARARVRRDARARSGGDAGRPRSAAARAARAAGARRAGRWSGRCAPNGPTTLLSDWGAFLDGLEAMPEDERPDAARPIGEVSGERIRKVYRRMLKMGGAIDASSPAEAYHELRKKGKELRYLLELFGVALFPEEVVKPMIKTLKALQDVLGRHQDREVQIALLRSLGPEVARRRRAARPR